MLIIIGGGRERERGGGVALIIHWSKSGRFTGRSVLEQTWISQVAAHNGHGSVQFTPNRTVRECYFLKINYINKAYDWFTLAKQSEKLIYESVNKTPADQQLTGQMYL